MATSLSGVVCTSARQSSGDQKVSKAHLLTNQLPRKLESLRIKDSIRQRK